MSVTATGLRYRKVENKDCVISMTGMSSIEKVSDGWSELSVVLLS